MTTSRPELSLRRAGVLLGILASAVCLPAGSDAAGPLLVNGAGAPLVWIGGAVKYSTDPGTLGQLDNAAAVAAVQANFAVWENVATSSATFTNEGSLSVDVTAANVGLFLGVCDDGVSPVIFDDDGSITDAIFGAGASRSVLGFAGPECGTWVPAEITEGVAVLNGKFVDGIDDVLNPEISLAAFDAVFVHEFGHYVNLDHSQVNLTEAFDSDPSNDDAVAVMFPFLSSGADGTTLHLDDAVSIATLYPAAGFAADFGGVSGSVFLPDGLSLFQGAYVVARRVDDPRRLAVGVASGARYFPFVDGGPPAPALRGAFEIPGLPPGNYTIEIEGIHPAFTGGSSVGPLDPPVPLPGPPEFWNGADEAASNPPDDPAAAVALPVSAGSTETGIDVLINGAAGDTYVGYKSKASRTGKSNLLPPNWAVTLDDVVLPNTEGDDPENYRIKRERHLFNAAAVNAAALAERPEVHYVRYKAVRGRETAAPAAPNGSFPKAAKHVPRRWDVFNQFGSLTVESKRVSSLLVPASADASQPSEAPLPPGDETHFLCYQVRLPRGVVSQQAANGRFRKDLQTFLQETAFDDCALNGDGLPSFGGTPVEGKCLYDVKKPFELCVPVTVSAVEPPRQTAAVVDGSTPGVGDPLACYGIKLATVVKSPGAAAMLNTFVGSPLDARQRKHLKRKLRDSTQVFTAPGNRFPAPTQLDTVKADTVCVPSLVQEIRFP